MVQVDTSLVHAMPTLAVIALACYQVTLLNFSSVVRTTFQQILGIPHSLIIFKGSTPELLAMASLLRN